MTNNYKVNLWGPATRLRVLGSLLLLAAWASAASAAGTVIGWGSVTSPTNIPNVAAAAAGFDFGLVLKDDGFITSWGSNTYGQRNAPVPNTGFVAIAAGLYHGLALKNDGSVVAWGDTSAGRCAVPSPNADFAAISAGERHSLGLRNDGSIVAWGSNADRQLELPQPNAGFVSISAGRYHSLALRTDGSIVAWGRNDYGQCNVPVSNTGFIAVAAGYSYSLGLRVDGSVVAWGKNDYGQCNVPSPNMGFTAIAGGYAHSLGIRAGGSIAAWGANNFGQCTVPVPNEGYTAISVGFNHSVAVKDAAFAMAIYDTPADEGGHLVASWRRHPLDPLAVTDYEVQKYVGSWTSLGTLAAANADTYSFNIATNDIFTIGRPAPASYYRLVAHTSVPGLQYPTPVISAYSVDNLPPAPPVAHMSDGADYRIIYWDDPGLADFGKACIYRGDEAGFTAAEPVDCPDEPFFNESHLAWFYYRVVFTDIHGNVGQPSNEVHGQFPTGAADVVPSVFALEQNYPNPFNPGTIMPFELPVAAGARLTIHDAAGRLVRVLVDGEMAAGKAEAYWNGLDDAGREVGSGVYFARLDAGGRVMTQRMVLLR